MAQRRSRGAARLARRYGVTGRLALAGALSLAMVALVALAPPVAIQIMGVIYVHRAKAVAEDKTDLLPDDGVIDLEDEEI